MCGVFGVVAPGQEAARIAALGIFALQHRGQESAGIAVSDGEQLMLYKDLGLIAQVLDDRRLPSLRGELAISHCRYSTTGSTVWENAQPTLRLGPRRALAVGHNGNLVNTRELLARLAGGRARLSASTDTELLTALIADEPATDTVDALCRVLPTTRGAYSLVILDERRVIGVRDPHGFRPLVLGRLPSPEPRALGLWDDADGAEGWVLSSETAGLDVVGAEYVRDVEPGEIVILEAGRAPISVRFAPATPALCVFELIYFARPDTYMEGVNLYEARRQMGIQLAGELDSHLAPRLVEVDPLHVGIRAGEVDQLEDAECGRRGREADRDRRPARLEDDDLARLHVADVLGADDVEARRLRAQDPALCAVGVIPEAERARLGRREPAQDERPEPVRVADADHPPLVEDHQAVGAARRRQHAAEGVD